MILEAEVNLILLAGYWNSMYLTSIHLGNVFIRKQALPPSPSLVQEQIRFSQFPPRPPAKLSNFHSKLLFFYPF